jgi:hypothetical protein
VIWHLLPRIALSPYRTAKRPKQFVWIKLGIGNYFLDSSFKSSAHFTTEVINDFLNLHLSH